MTRRFVLLASALVALNLFFLLAPVGLGAGGGLARFLLGPRLMRAEVLLSDGSDWLADRGRITQAGGGTLTLREADGRVVSVQVSPSARVTLGGKLVAAAALRRGMKATVLRQGSGAATIVQAQRR